MFKQLADKKLILVSGKGGVGKTTLSAAMALAFSREGRRVLLAEMNSQGQIATLLGHTAVGYEAQELAPRLHGMNVIPMKAFEEYVLTQLKFRSVYSAVFDNKFVRFFIEGAPGLSELMSIGKIYSMVDDYDVLIVDTPATGHGMSLLQVPTIVAEAVRVGPLKTHSEKIESLLKDPKRTALVNVTLPEEMPVAETLELEHWVRDKLGISLSLVLINAVYPRLFESANDRKAISTHLKKSDGDPIMIGLQKSFQMRLARATLQKHYLTHLKQELKNIPLFRIPYLFCDQFGPAELEQIGREVQAV